MILQNESDTIAAISTPYGESGIGIVRVSGPAAEETGRKLFRPKGGKRKRTPASHRVYYGEIVDPLSETVIDEALILFMKKPRTYTREDVLEFHCHGGFLVMQQVLACILRQGVRPAEPGEFTKRAFLNGRIDLAQAEAVIETIQARTPAGLRVANEQLQGRLSGEILGIREILVRVMAEIEARLDFMDEDFGDVDADGIDGALQEASKRLQRLRSSLEVGRIFREGLIVVIVGKTNAGKSSLLNALLGEERAIVTAMAGTTRDIVEEQLSLSGMMLRVVDTAGIRKWRNIAEAEGIKRTEQKIREADLVLLLLDGSRPLGSEDARICELVRKKRVIVVLNKMDLPHRFDRDRVRDVFGETPVIAASALTGEGIPKIKDRISDVMASSGLGENIHGPVVTAVRHGRCLEEALEGLKRGIVAGTGAPELLALEIRHALDKLGEIVGETATEDILDEVFSRFCVGK